MKRFLCRFANWVLDHSLWLTAIACAFMIGWKLGAYNEGRFLYYYVTSMLK